MVGNLRLTFDDYDGTCTEYVRDLDLSQSLARVSYRIGDREYRREYFCSYPDRVLVLRLTSSTPGAFNFVLHHDLTQTESTAEANGKELQIRGVINGNRRKYRVGIRVLNEGGEVAAQETQLAVKGADTVTILYAAATEYLPEPPMYGGGDPDALVQGWLKEAAERGYEGLKKRQTRGHHWGHRNDASLPYLLTSSVDTNTLDPPPEPNDRGDAANRRMSSPRSNLPPLGCFAGDVQEIT